MFLWKSGDYSFEILYYGSIMNLTEKKELILMECFMNVNHRKILLKEQEVWEIEYVCLVVKTKARLIKEIKIKI